jgi:hypothetical protein
METYQVPKEQAKIVVSLPPHGSIAASVFLSPFAEHHRGQETVADLFRTSAPFLPIRDAEGHAILIRKKSVRWVKVLEAERIEWVYFELRDAAPRTTVRLEFEDETSIVGDIYATTPEGHQRVSDVVNLTGPFLHVEAREGVYVVNLGHVSAIRIVEETLGNA